MLPETGHGVAPSAEYPPPAAGGFGYYFPRSPEQPEDWHTVAVLDDLGRSLARSPGAGGMAVLPREAAAFCLLIADDLVAMADPHQRHRYLRDGDLAPVPRGELMRELQNRRSGRLGLVICSQALGSPAPALDPEVCAADAALRQLAGRLREAARRHQAGPDDLRRLYQWLVLHDFLPAVCDPAVLAGLGTAAPLFARFLTRTPDPGEGRLPLPLEFAAAAMRLPHRLPLAPPNGLADLNLLDLRRGYLLNLPSAEDCIAGLADLGMVIPQLRRAELGGTEVLSALKTAGLGGATPLYYYLARESDLAHGGRRYGPLGSHLMAQTLIGLLAADPDSILHLAGSGADGLWHPDDGLLPLMRMADLAGADGPPGVLADGG